MTNLRELEEEIEAYEGTSGDLQTQNGLQLRQRKLSYTRPPTSRPKVQSKFPYSLVMKVETSEPRDVLQSERTCLTFVRFATALFFTALGIILNFKLDTSGTPDDNSGNNKKKYFNHTAFNSAISYILLVLALFVLFVTGINYFVTINRYAKHKIATYSFNNLTTIIGMTSIIVTLMAINITMIVEGYIEQS
ncbi:conserved hypothetical protein [Candida dubliniensis CD36]|uniref:DUF202 domain-containing protein n=1 Tax=Candida dubliniensis (strain CD36 / ATCC MYA-646 / CBS 7987 / NCPF 3949 / NRRL Y-17841) TaxID=573826 RepID=B9WLY8_CANDC|nr:conserved hypothetical protein [Candida dubliniensis CD36]CAX40100.1 conserved hypothetical protein [Candida dubliniensis CD36]